MFTLEDSLIFDSCYTLQIDLYTRIVPYVCGVILFFELLKSQISEIDLLQLIPGFFFLLFLLLYIFLSGFSDFFFFVLKTSEGRKRLGTKAKLRLDFSILLKFSFFFFSILILIVLNAIIPLSLDSFNFSLEKTLEDSWSLIQVVVLEIILLLIFSIISQIPLFFLVNFNTIKLINLFSKFWKWLVLILTILAGFLTPTLDGYTQISFALAIFSFYLLISNLLQKRIFLKFNIFLAFGN
jgi:hypothetical protein